MLHLHRASLDATRAHPPITAATAGARDGEMKRPLSAHAFVSLVGTRSRLKRGRAIATLIYLRLIQAPFDCLLSGLLCAQTASSAPHLASAWATLRFPVPLHRCRVARTAPRWTKEIFSLRAATRLGADPRLLRTRVGHAAAKAVSRAAVPLRPRQCRPPLPLQAHRVRMRQLHRAPLPALAA